jgi:replicative DNA helicase
LSSSTALKIANNTADNLPVRPLPHNYEAEQALLAALLYDNGAYEKISEFLIADHFSHPIHGKIYSAVTRLIEKGQIADPITLKDFFEQDKNLEEIGGVQYLAELVGAFISVINVEEYGRLIRDYSLRRQLIHLGQDVASRAYTPSLEISALEQIEFAEQRLYELSSHGVSEKNFTPFSQALTLSLKSAEKAYKTDGHIVGVTTGLRDLDRWLGGLHPSDLIILAGRPSMGKTALATNIAFNAARSQAKEKSGAVVAFFSLEMSSEQLATRILAQESGVFSDKIRRGDLRENDFPKFVEVSRELASLPLYIDDTPALSVSALRTRARRLQRKHGLGMIVVDYLQLLQAPHENGRRSDNRVNEISEISRMLKAIAKELNVPVLALSQLSRAVEQRDDKRPQLADLRESGSIEQDADVVMFIFREEYYEARREPQRETDKHRQWQERIAQLYNMAEVIIAKQRHGPVGTIKLYYDGPLTKFGNLADDTRLPQNF